MRRPALLVVALVAGLRCRPRLRAARGAGPHRARRAFPMLSIQMIQVGEQSGELEKMLYKVADNYDEEVDVLTESLVSLLEPLLIVVLDWLLGEIKDQVNDLGVKPLMEQQKRSWRRPIVFDAMPCLELPLEDLPKAP